MDERLPDEITTHKSPPIHTGALGELEKEFVTKRVDLSYRNVDSIVHQEILKNFVDQFIKSSLELNPNDEIPFEYSFRTRRLTANAKEYLYRSVSALSIDMLLGDLYTQEYLCKYMIVEKSGLEDLLALVSHEINLTNIMNADFKLIERRIRFQTTLSGEVNKDVIAAGVFWPWEQGISLHNALKKRYIDTPEELKVPLVQKFTTELFNILTRFNNNSIVHRDFKPANIILRNGANIAKDPLDFALLPIDFGISYIQGMNDHLKEVILQWCAPDYITPTDDTHTLAPEYDIAGFGFCLYKVLSKLDIYQPSYRALLSQKTNTNLLIRNKKMVQDKLTPLLHLNKNIREMNPFYVQMSNLALFCLSPTLNNINLKSLYNYLTRVGVSL